MPCVLHVIVSALAQASSMQHMCMALLQEAVLDRLLEEDRAAAMALASRVASQASLSSLPSTMCKVFDIWTAETPKMCKSCRCGSCIGHNLWMKRVAG